MWVERRKEEATMRYVSFIHRAEAGYGVGFPDLPTSRAACRSRDGRWCRSPRRRRLGFHVAGFVDHRPANPTPRSIDAIEADPELADWRCGADLVLIPLFLDRGSTRRVYAGQERAFVASGGTP